jgi:anti-sigma regulatory factor (Ser/Thr protein kinase)/DNA-binding response OmpR family regulator
MKLLTEVAVAELKSVSRLRKAMRARLKDLRLTSRLIDDMQLVFAELATNAVLHSMPAPRSIRLELESQGVWLRMSIIDDGGSFLGFDRRIAAIKLRDIAAKQESGLGLQLAVELLDDLTYRSGPPNTMQGWRLLACRRPTVLLIEDDAALLELFSAGLRSGARVLTASDQAQAWPLLSQEELDVVITSFENAEGPDFPIIQAIRDMPPDRRPATIVLTTDAASAGLVSNVLTDACQILERPVRLQQLRHALASQLASRNGVESGSEAQRTGQVATYRNGALETLVVGSSAPDGSSTLEIRHVRMQDRHRVVTIEGIRFDRRGAGDCAKVAGLVHSLVTLNETRGSPGELIGEVSGRLHAGAAGECTIVAMSVLDTYAHGYIEYASATGRPLTILGPTRTIVPVNCPAVGLMDGHRYETLGLQLATGEQLIMASELMHAGPPDASSAIPDWIEHSVRPDPDEMAQEFERRFAARAPLGVHDWSVVVVRPCVSPACA